ncbi:MAG: Uma2 family endonuclease [Lachnospiraceae bacterium]|nr:Uma2 family endonuclease [Lachnospiraceae bacterium]
MTIREMIKIKKDYGYSNEYIAEKAGVPVSTIQKVFSGTTYTPRRITLEALSKFFERKKENVTVENSYNCDIAEKDSISRTEENEAEYLATDGTSALALNKHNKTLKDYLALPDDIRVELIDGVFYDMSSPTAIHQQFNLQIATSLCNHIRANKGSCMAFCAPMDVQLDCDDKTVVEPDVFVVCDKNKVTKARIYGAPDFIIEVVSPSNWYHDTIRKLNKYKNAGVREYWMVVPETKKVIVYFFEKSPYPVEYTFDDKVQVNIWDGKCRINFKEIYDSIRFMY